MTISLNRLILLFAFVMSLIAVFGSLYFSEIANFIPCTLCWYQRICMYPLIVILGIGIYERAERIYKYTLPFSVVGLIIAIYHNLIQYSIIPESINVCSSIGACNERYINLYGFITIPLLSLIAFVVINILTVIYIIRLKRLRS